LQMIVARWSKNLLDHDGNAGLIELTWNYLIKRDDGLFCFSEDGHNPNRHNRRLHPLTNGWWAIVNTGIKKGDDAVQGNLKPDWTAIPCFQCNEEINNYEETSVSITLNKQNEQTAYFHNGCFKEIAGNKLFSRLFGVAT